MAERDGEVFYVDTLSLEITHEFWERIRETRSEIGMLEDMIDIGTELLDDAQPEDTGYIEKMEDDLIKLAFDLKSTRASYQETLDSYDRYCMPMHGYLPD